MTRQQAVKEYLEGIEGLNPVDRVDWVAIRCGFVDYIDMLQKEGRITSAQAFRWEGLKVKTKKRR